MNDNQNKYDFINRGRLLGYYAENPIYESDTEMVQAIKDSEWISIEQIPPDDCFATLRDREVK